MDLASLVVDAAKEEYNKHWAEKAITLQFTSPHAPHRQTWPTVEFLPEAEAWVFRHAGMEFKVPREKGQDEFIAIFTTLVNMATTSLGVNPAPPYDPYQRYADDEEPHVKAVLYRQGKEITRLVVCQGENMRPEDIVSRLRILWYLQ
ncbi:hypothetical protein HYH02_008922 [Chlamydomonas schloesseri]|uniref:Uncharacterized protein n=1 Tax=Chlamydomonas schloesseri TaxID=2026947 RepID=A0A835WD16_9CHLO|nr:hypothetical protein HYH02_008922 [Chlamydomonas schloesseri]|eukprot:KAG2445054.1 hypothetical protein HYH02_008922 [Chlamydomonas schloesseri]